MGMYLDVNVVYGVAWGHDECPSAAFPLTEDGGDQIEDGEPVYGGRLVWGEHGNTMGNAERHLAVVTPRRSGMMQGRYAERVPSCFDVDQEVMWSAWVIDYLASLGMEPEKIPVPGWLALASFG